MQVRGSSREQKRKRAARYAQAFGPYRAKWLLWREAFGDKRSVAWRHQGDTVYLRLKTTDIAVWASVFQRQEYGATLPTTPRVVLDGGAYTGLSAVYFAQKYPDAKIIAIEPNASNFDLLMKNTRPFPNVVPVNKALWYEDGPLTLYDRNRGHWAFSVAPPAPEIYKRGERVDAVTIASIMEAFAIDFIDVLKIDVEGAEKEIFEHSGEWIGRVGAIFAELHDRLRPGCTEALEAAADAFVCRKTSPMTVYCINHHRLKMPP